MTSRQEERQDQQQPAEARPRVSIRLNQKHVLNNDQAQKSNQREKAGAQKIKRMIPKTTSKKKQSFFTSTILQHPGANLCAFENKPHSRQPTQ